MIPDQLQSTGLFKKPFTEKQVEAINAITDWIKVHADLDRRHIAYILATIFHETAGTMRPIEEYGKGKGRKYGIPDPITGKTYYGRGFIQLTWADNYKRIGKLVNHINLYESPELALNVYIAADIAVLGMVNGWFTGHRLSEYINATECDYVQARRIINGLDKAGLIAGYAEKFKQAL